MTLTAYPNAADLTTADYLVIGIATCYTKEDGEVTEVTIAEPVPSAYLEAVLKGIPTSYQSLHGTTLGEVVTGEMPQMIAAAGAEVQFCSDFAERAFAAARTYQSRPSAQVLVPVGTTHTDVNYSTEKKRILNAKNIVSSEDNVKQHAHTHKVL
ncbi:MAG: hypothetical protein HC886_08835 [Leptolyngbyaceae cyanobacterium SM1_1_3]|nr:hypothetical protein [Leptolyngbyaceae cyanobacterium SM1_1_3]NJN01766.1 hypothetical protein [Leptolyngbyaceae cyanobacterium RM1_1_2]NJO09949.1 hypothetical protein [Leptolyngbyaceae cyanobacterium SL_1_1]